MNSKWNNKLTEKSAFKGGEIATDSNLTQRTLRRWRRHTNTHTHTHTNARTAQSLTAQKFRGVPAAAEENQQQIQLISMMDQRQSAGATNNIRTSVIKAHFTLPQSARTHARSHLSELAAGSHLSIKFTFWPTGRGCFFARWSLVLISLKINVVVLIFAAANHLNELTGRKKPVLGWFEMTVKSQTGLMGHSPKSDSKYIRTWLCSLPLEGDQTLI